MKSQPIIIKNKTQEHYVLEEFHSHKKRLRELIEGSTSSLKSEFDSQKSLMERRKKLNQLASLAHSSRKNEELEQENDLIGKKLDKIYFPDVSPNKHRRAKSQNTERSTAQISERQHQHFIREKVKIQKQIDHENEVLAYRLLNLEATVNPKKKLKDQYKQHKALKKRVQKYHVLKPFQEYSESSSDEDEGLFDMSNPDLLKERIHLYVNLLRFDASLRVDKTNDQFMLEIKGREGFRRTQPEYFVDFHKSVLNEYFTFEELKNNAMLHIAVFHQQGEEVKCFGEFDIDLRKYYIESGIYEVTFDLKDEQTTKRKHYYAPDYRRNGHIVFQLRVKSSLKKYLLDQLPEGMTFEEYRKQRQSIMHQQRASIRAGRASVMARGSIMARGSVSAGIPSALLAQGKRSSIKGIGGRPSIMFNGLHELPIKKKVEYQGRLSRFGPDLIAHSSVKNNYLTKVKSKERSKQKK